MIPNPHRICVLVSHIGTKIPICKDPSEYTVRQFIIEQHRRYDQGIPAGPSGLPSVKIVSAAYYANQIDHVQGQDPESVLDISDIARPNQ